MSRGAWASKLGFILAAAGSAIGLGNIWRFPFVTGQRGGGLFYLLYLVCVVLVGLPIMVAEVMIGRRTQSSPVAAFKKLAGEGSRWPLLGWMGVVTGFLILSFYNVVAGWTIHYSYLAITGFFAGQSAQGISQVFDTLVGSPRANIGYQALFMVLTVAVVIGGVRSGIERWSRILMPALFVMLVGLMVYCFFLPGIGEAVRFVFAPHTDKFTPGSVLEALGQAFFSLSLGMGAMLTYGSYLSKDARIPRSSTWVAVLDTLIATLASLVVFPIIFSFDLQPGSGPGLIFKSIPLAFSQMPGGHMLSVVLFVLIVFAGLTSSVSLQEVVTSSLIDLYGWRRDKVCIGAGVVGFAMGVPSALSGGKSFFGAGLKRMTGRTFLDWVDFSTANLMLPAGGLLTAIFTGHVLGSDITREEFGGGHSALYSVWQVLIKWVVPVAVGLVFLQSSGLLKVMGIGWE